MAKSIAPYLSTRFRALSLFGRRPAERVVRSVLPAYENLHASGLVHRSKEHPYGGGNDFHKPWMLLRRL